MSKSRVPQNPIDPVQLRGVFGDNLKKLTARYPSVASLCRELGINRTQFNRYLAAESFPRPDVLHKICTFFEVDARILLEPVDKASEEHDDLFHHPAVRNFLGKTTDPVSLDELPSGFYRFSRPSFVDDNRFVVGTFYVFRIRRTSLCQRVRVARSYERSRSFNQFLQS